MELQELIARGRFIFAGAQGRLTVFRLVNGRFSAKEIAKKLRRGHASVLNDLKKLDDVELIRPSTDRAGNPKKSSGSIVYEKVPLSRQIPLKYFEGALTRVVRHRISALPSKKAAQRRSNPLGVPSENEILDICKAGEDHTYEFKASGTEPRRITKEVAAFSHTRQGGIIFYGVDDDGTIHGTDIQRQTFDQRCQNSIRNTIDPPINVQIRSAKVLNSEVILVVVPPWNRKTVYFYEGRAYIRKGTNVFEANAAEIKKLHKGEYID